MSLVKHARRIADKAKAVADDLDAIYPADDADTAFVQESLRGHRPARDVLGFAIWLGLQDFLCAPGRKDVFGAVSDQR